MKRRDWLTATGALAGASALGGFEAVATGEAELLVEILRLNLRHTWTTTMSSSEHRDTVLVRYRCEGVVGLGEGAPIVRYREDAAGATVREGRLILPDGPGLGLRSRRAQERAGRRFM